MEITVFNYRKAIFDGLAVGRQHSDKMFHIQAKTPWRDEKGREHHSGKALQRDGLGEGWRSEKEEVHHQTRLLWEWPPTGASPSPRLVAILNHLHCDKLPLVAPAWWTCCLAAVYGIADRQTWNIDRYCRHNAKQAGPPSEYEISTIESHFFKYYCFEERHKRTRFL